MAEKMICIEPRGCLVNGKIYRKGDKVWDHEIMQTDPQDPKKQRPSPYFRPLSDPAPLEERLQAMKRGQLEVFGKKEFGVDVDMRKHKQAIIKELLKLAEKTGSSE